MIRRRFTIGLAVTVTVGLVATAAMAQQAPTADRLAGGTRVETAIETSQHAFPNGSLEVYLSNQNVNPDALVGGALTRGPILLVPQCGVLPDAVATEITRLEPLRVYGLGGPVALCDDIIEQALDAAPDSSQPGPPESFDLSGSGDVTTDSFEMAGGDYTVEYSYTADCFYGASLDNVSGGFSKSLPSGSGPLSGEDNLYGVDPGVYALDMIADNTDECPWQITIATR